MRVKLICTVCNTKYLCTTGNTQISNPILTTECPNCGEIRKCNVSAFAHEQADLHYKNGLLGRAACMINLMQNVAYVSNDDKHGVKMRKYTARRWNSQHTT
jgi:predicted RNA-binding Zn-ribbon protein involved in translation (DUF1610 family)